MITVLVSNKERSIRVHIAEDGAVRACCRELESETETLDRDLGALFAACRKLVADVRNWPQQSDAILTAMVEEIAELLDAAAAARPTHRAPEHRFRFETEATTEPSDETQPNAASTS
jgi:hypothetical protein